MLLFNSKALLLQWKLRNAAVNSDMYQNVQRHRAVLPAIARHSCYRSCHADVVERCHCRHWADVIIALYSLLHHATFIQQWQPSVLGHSTTLTAIESSQLTMIQQMISVSLNQQQVSSLSMQSHLQVIHIFTRKTPNAQCFNGTVAAVTVLTPGERINSIAVSGAFCNVRCWSQLILIPLL